LCPKPSHGETVGQLLFGEKIMKKTIIVIGFIYAVCYGMGIAHSAFQGKSILSDAIAHQNKIIEMASR